MSHCTIGRASVIVLIVLAVAMLAPVVDVSAKEASLGIPPSDEGLPGAGPIRRADWFHNVWNQRRNAWADQVEQDRQAVVFLGDSITQGWAGLGEAFPHLKVANRGISGDTTRGMLYRLDQDVLVLDPRCVVMLMGTNDLEEQATPETIAGNIELILNELREHNAEMPVVLCRVFPSSAEKKRPAEKIQALNELLAKLVQERPHVTLLDTWTLFANEQGDAKPEEFPDLLHPNKRGYAKWAAALRPILATLGFVETERVVFDLEPGFESLFNGKDLTGWGVRPTSEADQKTRENWRSRDPNAPPWPLIKTAKYFDGKTVSDSGRFLALNGRLVVKTPAEGRKIEQLWTKREFPQDFELRLEFRATPFADSGIYLRGRQLQCRDYSTAGPYKNLKNYQPQAWNEIRVTVRGNTAYCTCNGEVLEDAYELPASGPLGVEGDRGQMEYRNICVRILP